MTDDKIIENMATIIINLVERVSELERKQAQTTCFIKTTIAPALHLGEDDDGK